MSLRLRLIRPPPPAELGALWQSVAARGVASFFQGWDWTGTLFAERFPDPWLLLAEDGGAVRALALFNRTRRAGRQTRLWLGESGDPVWDRLFIEYNGILGDPALREPMLRAARHAGMAGASALLPLPLALPRAIMLSGIDDAMLDACRAAGTPRLIQSRAAPAIDLARLRAGSARGDHLGALSANTRAQLRRSAARYGRAGALRIDAAATLAEAEGFFAHLVALHEESWRRRNRAGAFADPAIPRFHRALIATALPQGRVELLRIAAGPRVLGYLYHFRQDGRVLAYQSGFDYAGAGPHEKPGLTCHALSIERALAMGERVYDMLAGAERYKQSLVPTMADATTTLHWVEMGTWRSWLGR
ncbi:MAG: GNAT family N-acetyltransferase [Rhodospirillales bacterium]|nr:GNAT family N-acetyltransferase [Rhodospirillales bacterium]